MFPQNSYGETPVPKVMMTFGDGALERESGHEGGAVMMGLPPLKEETLESLLPLSLLATWGHGKRMAICKAGRGFLPEPNQTGTLKASRSMGDVFLLFKPPNIWYFVTADRTD